MKRGAKILWTPIGFGSETKKVFWSVKLPFEDKILKK